MILFISELMKVGMSFDYLDFDLIEISDEEANVLQKYHIEGETIFDRFIDLLWDELVDLEFISEDDELTSYMICLKTN